MTTKLSTWKIAAAAAALALTSAAFSAPAAADTDHVRVKHVRADVRNSNASVNTTNTTWPDRPSGQCGGVGLMNIALPCNN